MHSTALVRRDELTPQDVLARFLKRRSPHTERAYRRDLQVFADWLELPDGAAVVRLLADLDVTRAGLLAIDYREHLQAQGAASATVNRRLTALRALVKLARQMGVLSYALEVDGLPTQRVREVAGPMPDDWRRLAVALEADASREGVRLWAAARLLFDVALRCFEVCGIRYEGLDLEAGTVQVTRKKRTGAPETITLPPSSVKALRAWVALRGDHPGTLLSFSVRALYRRIRRLGQRVCGKVVSPHRLRHLAITVAVHATGGDLTAVQEFSGHRDVRTVQWYIDRWRDRQGEIAGMVSRLEGV